MVLILASKLIKSVENKEKDPNVYSRGGAK